MFLLFEMEENEKVLLTFLTSFYEPRNRSASKARCIVVGISIMVKNTAQSLNCLKLHHNERDIASFRDLITEQFVFTSSNIHFSIFS